MTVAAGAVFFCTREERKKKWKKFSRSRRNPYHWFYDLNHVGGKFGSLGPSDDDGDPIRLDGRINAILVFEHYPAETFPRLSTVKNDEFLTFSALNLQRSIYIYIYIFLPFLYLFSYFYDEIKFADLFVGFLCS